MKTPFLIFSLLILISSLIRAQEVAPFQYKDKDAIRLTEKKLEPIFDTTWVCLKMYFTNREERNTTNFRHILQISRDGTWKVSSHGLYGGTWHIENNRLLALNFDSKKIGMTPFIGGGYSVLKLTDDELVIVKNLTSAFDNSIVYTYTPTENFDNHPEVIRSRKNRMAKANKKSVNRKEGLIRTIKKISSEKEIQTEEGLEQKNEEELTEILMGLYEEKIINIDKSRLVNQLKADYFMRNMKFPAGMDEMSEEELRELLRKLRNRN
ncbi:MAG: hypothetical protein GY705_07260 [Bacteroidetes bacterium]|nr:hypothetical protein [Bacteroidota bacterium]